MRAGKYGSNSPQFATKGAQTTAIVQTKFYCPAAAVAYLGRIVL